MILRNFFLYLSQHQGLRQWMETNPAARPLTSRFIAGKTLEDEFAACHELAKQGIMSALDHLGENVLTLEEAQGPLKEYLAALDQISVRKLPSTISIKLTQFGLDQSEAACRENVRKLVKRASEIGSRVEVDMESSTYTQRTLDIVAAIASELGHMRCVIQAYLFRSEADIERMNHLRIPVRLCKGAYNEPGSVAMQQKFEVDENYLHLMRLLLDDGAYPALATHDQRMIDETLRYAKAKGVAADRFEFQMLYGIRRDLQNSLVNQGYQMRAYVPYGSAWYPYFMRRLSERPANVLFVLKSLFRR